ncbi:MAG: DUF4118 domain-containing protein [Christensenellales bacterium]
MDSTEFRHNSRNNFKYSLKKMLNNLVLIIGIITISTLVSFAFRSFGLKEPNYIMSYILGVLFVAYLTDGYVYGIISSLMGVLVFNFFFTEPHYTLVAYSPEYPMTFLIMLIVALCTSTLTTRIKHESHKAEMREKRIEVLYQNERNLLAVKNMQQVADVTARDISLLFDCSVFIAIADLQQELTIKSIAGGNIFESKTEKTAYMEAFQAGNTCGRGTNLFPDSRAYFQPIIGQSGVLGIIGIAFKDSDFLSESQKVLLNTIGVQVALALERERLYEKQQKVKTEMDHERLRGDLLRSVSHDLRTPLTGILGSVSTVLDNYDFLSDDVRKDFLHKIYEDTEWLNHLVENILNMTRFSEENIKLKKEPEVVEELIAGAVTRIKKQTDDRQIRINIPEDLIIISVDGSLIEQVLVNLLDNAIKHTSEAGDICISAFRNERNIVFEVSDKGPGVPEQEIPYIFNRFYTSKQTGNKGRHGIGLGLAICKAIVEAHDGKISVHNNPSGGAVFRFTIPIKEV